MSLKSILETIKSKIAEDESSEKFTASTGQNKNSLNFELVKNINGSDLSGTDIVNHLKSVDSAEEEEVEAVGFGLETTDGKIVKIYVNAEEAEQFEQRMSQLLGQIDDIDEAIEQLSDEFDIVSVVKPDEMLDMEDIEDAEDESDDIDKLKTQLDEPLSDDEIAGEIEDEDTEEDEEGDSKDKKKKDEEGDEEGSEEGDEEDKEGSEADLEVDDGDDPDKDEDGEEGSDEDDLEADFEKALGDEESEDKTDGEEDEEETEEEDEEETDDETKDEESEDKPKKKKPKKKEKDQTGVKESKMSNGKKLVENKSDSGGHVGKGEAGHDIDVFSIKLTKSESELSQLFTTPSQQLIFRTVLLLGVTAETLNIRKYKVRKAIKSVANQVMSYPQIKNLLFKLGKELTNRRDEINKISEAIVSNSPQASIKDQLNTEISKKVYDLIISLGVPEFLLSYKKSELKNRIRNVAKIASKHTRIKMYIYMLDDLLNDLDLLKLDEDTKLKIELPKADEETVSKNKLVEAFAKSTDYAEIGEFSVVEIGEIGGYELKAKNFTLSMDEDNFSKMTSAFKSKDSTVIKTDDGKYNLIPSDDNFVLRKVNADSNDKYPFGVLISKKSIKRIIE